MKNKFGLKKYVSCTSKNSHSLSFKKMNLNNLHAASVESALI
jgi:hypothetical protein